jgi:hypothetical protein
MEKGAEGRNTRAGEKKVTERLGEGKDLDGKIDDVEEAA